MPLKEYKNKRDFRKTPEPKGEEESSSHPGRLFVIQKHAASRLHYDFRLELDGVLKSWAVPKGPSLDPGEKRLAVHVEDHPLEYGGFEGIIPEGEYGGGTVMLWDRGTWTPEGDPEEEYRKGRMHFEVSGEKLRGRWVLVKMGGSGSENTSNWLLMKSKDKFARDDPEDSLLSEENRSVSTGRTMDEIASDADAVWDNNGSTSENTEEKTTGIAPSEIPDAAKAEMPSGISPQSATLADAPPTGNRWIHEFKYDGYRIMAFIRNGTVRLSSRNSRDWTDRFPTVAEALSNFPADEAVVDGEVVVQLPDGTTDFQALQNMLQGVKTGTLIYYLFDILHCDGYDLTRAPLIERKKYLKQMVDHMPPGPTLIRFSDHIEGSGDAVYELACQYSLEGIISKAGDSPYQQKRSRRWLKIKCLNRQEFVIGGYTKPSGSRTGFGSLLLGAYNDGKDLLYCGRVGTGFNEKQLSSLKKQMEKIERKTPPFSNPPKGPDARDVHWITPELVGEIEFSGWTQDKVLRHPAFKGLREDKSPEEVRLESSNFKSRGDSGVKKEVRLTNPDRILYPEQGVSKAGLAAYYEWVADYMLPYVAHRPLTLLRCPRGRDEECFYQKHLTESSFPEFLRGIEITEKNGSDTYIVIDDAKGLVSLVQMGVLEIHIWNAREDRIERPDLLVMDIDPAPGVGLDVVVEGTRMLHDFLADLGLKSFLKTSGGKGFHVVVPLVRRSGWDELKGFARGIADHMTRTYPDRFLATASKKKREGKIFLDYLRNGRGATSVAPYSTRAKPGAPVSVPLDWDELSVRTAPDAYRIDNIRKRISALKTDPWKDFSDVSQSITKLMKNRVGLQ